MGEKQGECEDPRKSLFKDHKMRRHTSAVWLCDGVGGFGKCTLVSSGLSCHPPQRGQGQGGRRGFVREAGSSHRTRSVCRRDAQVHLSATACGVGEEEVASPPYFRVTVRYESCPFPHTASLRHRINALAQRLKHRVASSRLCRGAVAAVHLPVCVGVPGAPQPGSLCWSSSAFLH